MHAVSLGVALGVALGVSLGVSLGVALGVSLGVSQSVSLASSCMPCLCYALIPPSWTSGTPTQMQSGARAKASLLCARVDAQFFSGRGSARHACRCLLLQQLLQTCVDCLASQRGMAAAELSRPWSRCTTSQASRSRFDVRRQEQVDVTDSVLGIMARAMWRAGAAGLGSPFH